MSESSKPNGAPETGSRSPRDPSQVRLDFLKCRFRRRLEWLEGEGSRVVVLRPRFGESRIGRKLSRLLGLSDYRIRLDEIGTAVWHRCDGEATAADIAAQLRDKFGEKVEPAEQRLHHFITQMRRARMITILPPEP